MREILVRGKRVDDGEWVEGCLLVLDGKEYRIATSCLQGNDKNLLTVCAYMVDQETVGQFTGLQDKNGKRIWEGDVVTIPGSNKMGLPAPVEYRKLGATFLVARKGYTAMNLWGADERYEVIGNIHDNGELLEVR